MPSSIDPLRRASALTAGVSQQSAAVLGARFKFGAQPGEADVARVQPDDSPGSAEYASCGSALQWTCVGSTRTSFATGGCFSHCRTALPRPVGEARTDKRTPTNSFVDSPLFRG